MKRLALLLLLVSCGSEREIEVKAGPPPVSGPPPVPGALSFNDVKPIIDEYCAPCHGADPYVKSSTGWFASNAQARTRNNTMPPPASSQAKRLSASDRAKLLEFK